MFLITLCILHEDVTCESLLPTHANKMKAHEGFNPCVSVEPVLKSSSTTRSHKDT